MHADLHARSRQLKLQVLPSLKPLADVILQAALYFCHQGGARCQPHCGQPPLFVEGERDTAWFGSGAFGLLSCLELLRLLEQL